jgi:amidophosphoribosyltransferase
MGLIRNHYVGRTFIEPRQSIRHFGVRVKLNPVRSILEGQRVVLVDDSIVRGTTSRKIVKMVRAAGAREVHMRISCPPTISPCFYGVDTPRRSELIAATHTLREIQKYIEADSLGYLSLEGLLTAVGPKRGNYCTSCYTGQYPVAFPQSEAAYLQLALKLDPASNERRSVSNEQGAADHQQSITNDDDLKVPSLEEEDVKLGVGKR